MKWERTLSAALFTPHFKKAAAETTAAKVDNKLEKKSAKSDKEIGHEELLACVKIGSKFKYLTPEMLKKHVFPCMENTWPELTIAQLEVKNFLILQFKDILRHLILVKAF